jgi:hypothetical protein
MCADPSPDPLGTAPRPVGDPADAHLAIQAGHDLVFDLVGEQRAQQGDAGGDPCLRIQQASLVCINTLMLQAVLTKPQ